MRIPLPVFFIIIALINLSCLDRLHAHSPHDEIDQIAVGVNSSNNSRLYILLRGLIRRSTDNGKTWEVLRYGLQTTHSFHLLATSADGSHLVVTTKNSEIFFSANEGSSWQKATIKLKGAQVKKLSFSRDNLHLVVLLTSTGLMYVSRSSGRTWEQLNINEFPSDFSFIRGVASAAAMIANQSLFIANINEPLERYYKLDICKRSRALLLASSQLSRAAPRIAVVCSDKSMHILDEHLRKVAEARVPFDDSVTLGFYSTNEIAFVSKNTGFYLYVVNRNHWQHKSKGLTLSEQADFLHYPQFREFQIIDMKRNNPVTWLASFNGLYRSDDKGEFWNELGSESANIITGLTVLPDSCSNNKLVVSTYLNGLFKTTNGGTTWQSIDLAGRGQASDISVSPRYFNVMLSQNFVFDRRMFTTSWGFFYISEDGGSSFRKFRRPAHPIPDVSNPSNYIRRSKYIKYFLLPSGNHRSLFALSSNGILIEWDTIEKSYSQIQDFGERINASSYLKQKGHFHISALTDRGIITFSDDQKSWNVIQPANFPKSCKAIASGHSRKGVITYVGCPEGLFRFDGATQQISRVNISPHLSDQSIQAIAISPLFYNDGTILVSLLGFGLYRSIDGAKSFQKAGAKLDQQHAELSLTYNSTSSAITFASKDCPKLAFGVSDQHIYRSKNAGKDWGRLSPLPEKFIAKAFGKTKEIVPVTLETTPSQDVGKTFASDRHFTGTISNF